MLLKYSWTCFLVNICVHFCWVYTQEWNCWVVAYMNLQHGFPNFFQVRVSIDILTNIPHQHLLKETDRQAQWEDPQDQV